MEDIIGMVISGFAELFCELFSFIGNCMWNSCELNAIPMNMDVTLSLACIVMGAGAGTLSAIIVKHALLPKASLRIAMLFLSPPAAGLGVSHYLNPREKFEQRLFSRAFWLTFWVVLTYLAMRLVHIIR